ncbi:hypothetical protein DXG01_004791 [Tephrocybe rancida]|nr:hypothetical protein DXG01_004791 [Tephrocybe rancida]
MVKNIIGSGGDTSNPTTGVDHNRPSVNGQSGTQNPNGASNNPRSQYDIDNQPPSAFGSKGNTDYERPSKLSAGTGIGTTGRGDSTITGDKNRGIGSKEFVSGSGGIGKRGDADIGDRGSIGTGATGAASGSQHHRRTSDVGGTGFGGGTGMRNALATDHTMGHRAEHMTNLQPNENATNDSHQLHREHILNLCLPALVLSFRAAVTHERVGHHETEEVLQEREHDRHVHHVQHHTQPVIDKNIKNEVHHDKVHPVTNIRENHTNKPEEGSALHGQVRQHKDSLEHGDRQRVVVDKGETVNEREHHHVHHIVQPIINKETVEQHRVHTTIPIHQVTHEAPVVHKSQTHAPVSMEHFAQKGGQIAGGLSHDQVSGTVLRDGQCTREVDGEGEEIARKLTGTHISEDNFGRHSDGLNSSGGRIGEQGRDGVRPDIGSHGKGGLGKTGTNSSNPSSTAAGRAEKGMFADGSRGRPTETHGGRGHTGPSGMRIGIDE